jgi:signal transduction histidine kinase
VGPLPPVLVVDDEEMIREVLRESLLPHFEVATAASGEEALALLRQRDFAVLLADQRMPGMTGVALAAEGRELQPYLVTILLSGYTDPDDMIAAINHGQVYRFISKPWDFNDLLLTLQQAAERHRLGRDNARLLKERERRLRALEIVQSVVMSAAKDAHQHPAGVLLDRLREVIPFDLGAVLLAPLGGEPATLQLTSAAPVSQTNALELRDRALSLYEYLAGAPLAEDGVRLNATLAVAAMPERRVESQLQVPLSLGQRVVGLLLLQSFAPDAFADDAGKLLDLLANGTAEALEQIRGATHRAGRLAEQSLATLKDGLVLADAQGRVLHANPSAKALLDGAGALDLWQWLGVGTAEAALSAPADSGRDLQVGHRFVQASFARSAGPGAASANVVVTLRDITAERQREVRRRQFISTLSHEIRTPLSSIVATIDLLLHGLAGSLVDKQRQYLSAASKACDTLHAIVDDLLDIEKQAVGAVTLRPRPLQIAGLLREAANRFRAAALEHEVEIEVTIRQENATVVADPMRLEQVLGNLLSNAIKYAPSKSVVRAELVVPASPCGWVVVGVQNAGEVISPEDVASLFDRFSRPTAAGRQHQHSSGLGLTICRSLVQAHGGSIFAESDPSGTALWVALPSAASAATPAALPLGAPLWLQGEAAARVAAAALFAKHGLPARLLPRDAATASSTRQSLGVGLVVKLDGEGAGGDDVLDASALSPAALESLGETLATLARHGPRGLVAAPAAGSGLQRVFDYLGVRSVAAGASAHPNPIVVLLGLADELAGKLAGTVQVHSLLLQARERAGADTAAVLTLENWEGFIAAYGASRAALLRESLASELAQRLRACPSTLPAVSFERGILVVGALGELQAATGDLPAAFAALARLHCRRDDRDGFIQLGAQRLPLPELACQLLPMTAGDDAIVAALGASAVPPSGPKA